MRDLNKITEAGHKKLKANSRRGLYAVDCIEIIKNAKLPPSDNLLELISDVYAAGFEEGYRAGKIKSNARISF